MQRTVTAALWLVATWWAGSAIAAIVPMPAIVAPLAALAVSLLIWWDPRRALWGPRLDRTVIRRRIADLERVSPAGQRGPAATPAESAAD